MEPKKRYGFFFWPSAIVVAMLLFALWPGNDYFYYIVLRVVIFFFFGFVAWYLALKRRIALAVLYSAPAIVYNPIIFVHLTREIWSVINLVTAAFALSTIPLTRHELQEDEKGTEGLLIRDLFDGVVSIIMVFVATPIGWVLIIFGIIGACRSAGN